MWFPPQRGKNIVDKKESSRMKTKKKYRIRFNSPMVLGLVALCFAATIAGILSGGRITRLLFMTYRAPLTDPLTYLRFFTHILGHGSWAHFLGNASYLLLLGPLLEEKYGSGRLVVVALLTAAVTGLVNYLFFPAVALCGSSGVVFAFILLASFTSFREGDIPLTFILVSVIFIGQQVYEGIVVQDNISNMAHIVGGLIGGVAGYQLNRKRT